MQGREKILQEIIQFADLAHGKQVRRYTSERYIVHPVRVMETCRQYTNDISVLAAAILHDVLEDTP
jgi:(p)ppGpp synthase/HD superfamily hydrolase